MGHYNDFVTVHVSFNNCTPLAPTLAVFLTTQNATPGSQISYTVNVTNNDSSDCGSTTFYVTPSAPSGWTVSPTVIATLAPGDDMDITLSVTVPETATAGNYTVSVSASDGVNSVHSRAANAAYVVQSASNPVVDTLRAKLKGHKKVVLKWKSPKNVESPIVGYEVYRDTGAGFSLLAQTTRRKYIDLVIIPDATYAYYVTPLDDSGDRSGPSNVATALMPVTLAGSPTAR